MILMVVKPEVQQGRWETQERLPALGMGIRNTVPLHVGCTAFFGQVSVCLATPPTKGDSDAGLSDLSGFF